MSAVTGFSGEPYVLFTLADCCGLLRSLVKSLVTCGSATMPISIEHSCRRGEICSVAGQSTNTATWAEIESAVNNVRELFVITYERCEGFRLHVTVY